MPRLSCEAMASSKSALVFHEIGGTPNKRLIQGDVLEGLRALRDESVQCVVTSPPYFWQRDYGFDGQIGHEPTIDGYVLNISRVFREVMRVLNPSGVVFLNMGDTYYSAKGKPRGSDSKNKGRMFSRRVLRAVDGPGLGLTRKSLIGIPWRTIIRLQQDGWTLRGDVIWWRPGTMPEVKIADRPRTTHEHIFILSKSPRYYFDRGGLDGEEDVWRVADRPAPSSKHAAPFPMKIADRCIRCGSRQGDVVLDPFVGSGTVMRAASKLGRDSIGIEMSSEYCARMISDFGKEVV